MPESKLTLIDQGTYGCVFHPGINCKGNLERINYITKIQKRTATIENEIKIGELIQNLKASNKYYAPILSQCPVRIAKAYVSEMKQCDLFESSTAEELQNATYMSNKVRYVGSQNLADYILEKSTLVDFWRELIESHIFLLRSYDRLNAAGIVHYDVKFNNILVDKKTKHPIIIDFGLSFHVPDLSPATYQTYFYTFNSYYYWCVESCIFGYMFTELGYDKAKTAYVSKSELETIVNVFLHGNPDRGNKQHDNDVYFSPIFANKKQIVPQFTDNYMEFFGKYVGKTWMDLYADVMKNEYYKTWDAYGLCVVYLFILEDLSAKSPDLFQKIGSRTQKAYAAYVDVLYENIVAMPDKRKRANDMIPMLKQLAPFLDAAI